MNLKEEIETIKDHMKEDFCFMRMVFIKDHILTYQQVQIKKMSLANMLNSFFLNACNFRIFET